MKKSNDKIIQDLLSSKSLRIKALTSAGIISGIVIDIYTNSSKDTTSQNFLDSILENLSSDLNITNQGEIIYVIGDAKLYPISDIKQSIFLDRIELNSSKIIALCPPDEEVD